jgi:steroid delta-isomerase-like uncharacterized protein
MSANRDNLRRLLEDAIPHADMAFIELLHHRDVRVPEDMHAEGRGLACVKSAVTSLSDAFSNFRITVDDLLEDGAKLAARLTVSGVHKGPIFGLPATGRSFSIQEMFIAEFHDGKIREFWRVADLRALAEQLADEST